VTAEDDLIESSHADAGGSDAVTAMAARAEAQRASVAAEEELLALMRDRRVGAAPMTLDSYNSVLGRQARPAAPPADDVAVLGRMRSRARARRREEEEALLVRRRRATSEGVWLDLREPVPDEDARVRVLAGRAAAGSVRLQDVLRARRPRPPVLPPGSAGPPLLEARVKAEGRLGASLGASLGGDCIKAEALPHEPAPALAPSRTPTLAPTPIPSSLPAAPSDGAGRGRASALAALAAYGDSDEGE
jgi:hypothetical protein